MTDHRMDGAKNKLSNLKCLSFATTKIYTINDRRKISNEKLKSKKEKQDKPLGYVKFQYISFL